LRSGQYILGPEVGGLEKELAAFVGTKYSVTCASGTDALMIALMAKGIGPGDAVFTTPFTFVATAEVIALLGAVPVFVDIDPETYNIDAAALERAITDLVGGAKNLRARAILPVDLFGLPADYDRINAVAKNHDLDVVEDAAQSFGGDYNGRKAGCLAEIGCTSFFPAKPLGCYGDGGALFTDDESLAQVFQSIRVHGQGQDRYENIRLGITGRMDTLQAAILQVKLRIFPAELEARQRVANTYASAIQKAGLPLVAPQVPQGYVSAWAQYSLLAENSTHRQLVMDKLKAAGIPTAIYYPRPLHLQKAFAGLGYREGDFPICEGIAKRIFSVPMHPYLTDDTIETIVSAMV
jgi:dTDP-4-amino-4,6-dideoxygalactose transaminase